MNEQTQRANEANRVIVEELHVLTRARLHAVMRNLSSLIERTPTSRKRELYTEVNILTMEAERKLREAEDV